LIRLFDDAREFSRAVLGVQGTVATVHISMACALHESYKRKVASDINHGQHSF
jgi:hypothetical protein